MVTIAPDVLAEFSASVTTFGFVFFATDVSERNPANIPYDKFSVISVLNNTKYTGGAANLDRFR